MAYTRDWDETQPVNHTKIADIPDWIRKAKIDVAERLKNWIYGFISGETQEGLKKAPLVAQLSAPIAEVGKGFLYTKDVGGVIELFYIDSSGNEVQLTTNGEINDWKFRSGDLLLSSNYDAPPGWTDVSATYENKFIRISSGVPLVTGGSDTHDHGGVTGAHALTIDEMPAHYHLDGFADEVGYFGAEYGASHSTSSSADSGNYFARTSTVGGGLPHSHTLASADNIPAYVQVRIYMKD